MKLQLVRFDGFGTDYDITIGKYYECQEVFDGIHNDCYEFIDDSGDSHKLRKTCFKEHPSEWRNDKWYPSVGSYCSLYKNPDVNRNKDDSLIHKKIKILAYDAGDVVYRVVDGKYFPIESQKDIQFIFKPFKSEKDF